MTPMYADQIDRKIAWQGSDFRGKDDIAFDLSGRHIAALKDILKRVENISLEEIRREHCGHPALDDDLAKIFDEVQSGRGIVILRGIPIASHSLEEIEKMAWALDTHFGVALSQNCLGHRITRVQEEPLPGGLQTARGHKSRQDLAMHTDYAEIFTLLCVRSAKQGGETQFTSTLAVHNEILNTRPDILPILYRGFPHHRRNDQPDNQPRVTPYDVPIFSNVNGSVSFCLVIGNILAALHEQGRQLTDKELEALDVLQEVMTRLQLEFRYEPGEMTVVNNLIVVHSRSEYVDAEEPEKRRLLLRIWLEALRDRRPVVPQICPYENENGKNGIDPVPGRKNKRNEYEALPESLLQVIKEGQKKRIQHTTTG